MPPPTVRRLTEYVPLTKEQFRERFFARFYDPVFEQVSDALEQVFEKAWEGYEKYRKSPRTRPARLVMQMRSGTYRPPDEGRHGPRQK